jgi:hypothetical protein
MTRAHWVVRTSRGATVYLAVDAMKKGEVDGLVVRPGNEKPNETSAGRGEPLQLKQWERAVVDDTVIETRLLTVCVDTPAWTVNVTSRPIYGLVQPLINGTHIHGHWQADQRRLDIEVDGVFPQPDAHGILGQSYQDAAVRNGRLDEYGIDAVLSAPNETTIPGEGVLPPMTTSAQAEGAIEGTHAEYKLPSAFSTTFRYSRFERMPEPHAALKGPVSKRSASTSEWDGKGWLSGRRSESKREL